MIDMINEIRIKLFDVNGVKYATCSSVSMAFLLDHCSVIEVIDDLIDTGSDEMFIETSYEEDDETFKAYYITQDGVMRLSKEFGRSVEMK